MATKSEIAKYLNDRLPDHPYWKKEGKNALSLQESKQFIKSIYHGKKQSKIPNKIQ